MIFRYIFKVFVLITAVNIIVSDKNNQVFDCVKDIKVEQNYLHKIYTAENNLPINQNEGNIFKYILYNQNNQVNK